MGRHVLRHAWATDTLEAGGNLRTVQAILGHADIRQTQWYPQISPQTMAATTDQTVAYRANQSRTSHDELKTDEQTPHKSLKR